MTDPTPMSELSVKTARGILWNLAENFGLQAVQFIVSIMLARLLLPSQFGLIGMISLFILLAQSLLDSGFGNALIQKRDADQIDICSVFYFNLFIGVILTSLLWLAAPFIALFYAQPLLTSLTRFLSSIILLNAFRLVPSVLLTKRLNFKAMFKISLTAVIVSGGVGVILAFLGFGVWSLAIQSALETFMRMFMVWILSRWKPSLVFSVKSLRTMFTFGSRLMVVGLLDTFFDNIYQLFIGKVYTPTDLGYYVRAQGMQNMAIQPTGGALTRVMFPALVPIQEDKARLKQAYKKIMATAVFFHFPIMVGLIVVAKPLILFLMTQRWAPSIPYFQLFCLVGLFWPLHVLNLNILQVIGRSDLYLRLEIARKILVVSAIVITYRFGITALLYGQISTVIVSYFINSYFCGKQINYSTSQQIRDMYPFLVISIGMGISTYLIGYFIPMEFLKLLIQVMMGIIIYLALNILIDRSVLNEAINLFRNAIGISEIIYVRKNV